MTHLEIVLAFAVFALFIAEVRIFMRLGRLDEKLHDFKREYGRDGANRNELQWANKKIETQEKRIGLMADHLHIKFVDVSAHTEIEVRK